MRVFTSRLVHTSSPPTLYASYRSRRAGRDYTWGFPLAEVACVRVGLPKAAPGAPPPGVLTSVLSALGAARAPRATLSLTLEDARGACLVHLEAGGPHQLDSLLRTLSVLAQWARSRGGQVEALPEATLAPPQAEAAGAATVIF
jgi:hypothetical protein